MMLWQSVNHYSIKCLEAYLILQNHKFQVNLIIKSFNKTIKKTIKSKRCWYAVEGSICLLKEKNVTHEEKLEKNVNLLSQKYTVNKNLKIMNNVNTHSNFLNIEQSSISVKTKTKCPNKISNKKWTKEEKKQKRSKVMKKFSFISTK